jgi:hypothetical protein
VNQFDSHMHRTFGGIVLGLALIGLGGCSSTPQPRPEVAQAERAVDQAIATDGATEHAALEIQKARDKLNGARAAMQEERYADANRLADEALVDAELARAKAEAATLARSADELARTIERLRDEAQTRVGVPPVP